MRSIPSPSTEHRLLFFAGQENAPTEKPVIPQNLEAAKDKLVGLQPDALEHINTLVDENAKKTGETEKQKQERYLGAVEQAAQTEFEYLITTDDPSFAPPRPLNAQEALQKIQQQFTDAGIDVHLVIDGTGNLIVEAHKASTPDRMTQEGIPPEVQRDIQAALGTNPEAMQAVLHLAETIDFNKKGNVNTLKGLMTEIKAAGSAAPYIFTDGIRILEKNDPATRDADVDALKLTDGAKTALKAFLTTIDGDADMRPMLLSLGASFKAAETMQNEQTRSLSDKDIANIATEVGLDKFDASTAKQIDKDIMLARLRLAGIDADDESKIFQRPPELKEFQGSQGEKVFNRFVGLIQYVVLSFQKLKDSIDPNKNKKEADKNSAAKESAGTSPVLDGKTVSDIRKEMKATGQFGVNYVTLKKGDLAAAQGTLGLQAGAVATLEAQAKTDPAKQAALETAKGVLRATQDNIQKIENQIKTAEDMLKESQEVAGKLDNKITTMRDVTLAHAKVAALPGVPDLVALLGGLTGTSDQLGNVSLDFGGGIATPAQLRPLFAACAEEIGLKTPEEVFHYGPVNAAEGLTGREIQNPRDLLEALNKLEKAYQDKTK